MTKKQVLRLLAICYGTVLAAWLLLGLWHFALDSVQRATGSLQTQEYDFTTLEPYGITVTSPTQGVSEHEDPQLTLSVPGRAVEVQFSISFSKGPGEVTLYYAKANEDFSKEKKIWGKPQNDGSYLFSLPRTSIDKLRIDPTNLSGVEMTLHSFTLNAPRAFWRYFAFTYENAFHFLVWPGLAAAFLGYLFTEYRSALVCLREKLFRLLQRSPKKEG